jgi:hypothetical protein
MSNVTQVIKSITLDMTDIPRDRRKDAKRDASDFLKNEILRRVQDGRSPVQGEGRFKRLEKDYAKDQKGGVRTANLQLEGDLLDSLKDHSRASDRIDMGHKGKEAPKADGHNQLSGEAKAWASKKNYPKRRYIPDDKQNFTSSIRKGIDRILDEYREVPEQEVAEIDTPASTVQETPEQVTIGIDSLFSDDAIALLLADALAKSKGGFNSGV